jgi:3-oxoacyl-[acyl-carrier protein] reductase
MFFLTVGVKLMMNLANLMLLCGISLVTKKAAAAKPSAERLANKVAVIIGASKGIGKGIAEVFATHGAKVVLVSRAEKPLIELAEHIRSQGGEASIVVADVSSEDDMQKMVAEVLNKYSRIDILIQNAGIYPFSRIENMSSHDWHTVMNTNLNGTFYAVKACLPTMKKQNYGRIVLTSSISGPRVGLPGASHYTASKAGINGFMKTIAIELAKYNITVNAVEPGNIISEGFEELGEDHLKKMTKAIPLGRLGTPEEVAYAHLFLASDEARYITGQSIVVDGGQLLPESSELDY